MWVSHDETELYNLDKVRTILLFESNKSVRLVYAYGDYDDFVFKTVDEAKKAFEKLKAMVLK